MSSSNNSKNTIFKQLTLESISRIHERIVNEKARLEIEKNEAEMEQTNLKPKGQQPKKAAKKKEETVVVRKPDKDFEAGKTLTHKYSQLFPSELSGIPLEEVDEYYKSEYVIFLKKFLLKKSINRNHLFFTKNKIFIVINKSRQVFRFSAKKAMFLLDPFNKLRRAAIFLLTHSYPFLF